MKATGIVRRIDDLGRVVIPKELRRTHFIEEGDPLEYFVEGDKIIIRKYQPGCILCGNNESLHLFHGKQICTQCISKASELTKSN
ncbi:AbrB/MazE/SpoVT family DNA-binding domain-containing protein [Paenibacillus sp. FSL K6-0108]|uniref:AbrB/MazE/SpoVT family DNA-binding domain-containing protein n=1 Tax=Paenibacillus sp. FSL K6-0108 TaxID=2921417 RepID=UPI0032486A5A